MPLSRPNLILLPALLALALPGWAETRPADAKAAQDRPLNLSLPRDVLRAPANPQMDETVERNLRASVPSQDGTKAPAHPALLPYGAGYEHRRQDMGGTGSGTGSGAAGGGTGRRGR
jgi:hypothetical protein